MARKLGGNERFVTEWAGGIRISCCADVVVSVDGEPCHGSRCVEGEHAAAAAVGAERKLLRPRHLEPQVACGYRHECRPINKEGSG